MEQLSLPEEARKICVKLNLCEYRSRETGATSDPYVVDALLKVLREKYPSSDIYLIENDATGVKADNIFKSLEIESVAKENRCFVSNVARDDWIKKTINGMYFKEIMVPKLIQDSDLFITHPKLKTHGGTKISCGLKNQFGLLKPKRKIRYHSSLDEVIVDTNIAMKPHLSIVDADVCMEGNCGPTFGIPKKLGLLLGGNDIVAVDSFCAKLMGFRPCLVGHIRKAAKKNLGTMKYHLITDFEFGGYRKYKFKFNYLLYLALKLVRGGLQRSE